MLPPDLPTDRAECIATLKASVTEANGHLRASDADEQARTLDIARGKQLHLLATKPKKANAQINRKNTQVQGVPGTKDEKGNIATDPIKVRDLVQHWWTHFTTAVAGKTGAYLPRDPQTNPAPFPWTYVYFYASVFKWDRTVPGNSTIPHVS